MIVIQVQSKALNRLAEELTAIMEAREDELIAKGMIGSRSGIRIIVSPPLTEDRLGFYDSSGNTIVISEECCSSAYDAKNVLLHELAHALDFRINGFISGHSPKFREYCRLLGVDGDFSKSKARLSIRKDRSRRDKIQKLMALSSSPFENEASEAIRKAQSLMLECRSAEAEGPVIYTADLFSAYRLPSYSAHLLSYLSEATGIYGLRWQDNDGLRTVRIHGALAETELAVYIYTYLMTSSETAIRKLRKQGTQVSRTSFMLGAIRSLSSKLSSTESKSLALINAENEHLAIEILYPEAVIRKRKEKSYYDRESYGLGNAFGSKLAVPRSEKKLLER